MLELRKEKIRFFFDDIIKHLFVSNFRVFFSVHEYIMWFWKIYHNRIVQSNCCIGRREARLNKPPKMQNKISLQGFDAWYFVWISEVDTFFVVQCNKKSHNCFCSSRFSFLDILSDTHLHSNRTISAKLDSLHPESQTAPQTVPFHKIYSFIYMTTSERKIV